MEPPAAPPCSPTSTQVPGFDALAFVIAAEPRVFRRRRRPTRLRALEDRWNSARGTAMVADIFPGRDGSMPRQLTAVGDAIVLRRGESRSGAELWTTDGTASGTRLVKDIHPGPADTPLGNLVALHDRLCFVAADDAHGAELWCTDGTGSGTRCIQDIYPGPTGARPRYLTALGSVLFFQAGDPEHGIELWKSDGTPAGTVRIKDIRAGRAGFAAEPPECSWANAVLRRHRWCSWRRARRSDGTSRGHDSGCRPERGRGEFITGEFFPPETSYCSRLVTVCTAGNPGNLTTGAAPEMVADLRPGAPGPIPKVSSPSDDGIAFVADDAHGTSRLWKLDSNVLLPPRQPPTTSLTGGAATARATPVIQRIRLAHADLAYSPQNCFSIAAWISSGARSRTCVAMDQEWP